MTGIDPSAHPLTQQLISVRNSRIQSLDIRWISDILPAMQVLIARWGNSLGLRVPKEIAARLGLREGTRVEVDAKGRQIVISVNSPVYTLEELLEGMTPEAMHEAFDWGEDVGRERIG